LGGEANWSKRVSAFGIARSEAHPILKMGNEFVFFHTLKFLTLLKNWLVKDRAIFVVEYECKGI
jgi:hypothetical protein